LPVTTLSKSVARAQGNNAKQASASASALDGDLGRKVMEIAKENAVEKRTDIGASFYFSRS